MDQSVYDIIKVYLAQMESLNLPTDPAPHWNSDRKMGIYNFVKII